MSKNTIIPIERSIMPACDVETLDQLKRLVKETCNIAEVSPYKIGFELVIPFGMKKVVDTIREFTGKPIVYDHQKAGTDVPFTGEKFARVCKESGVDAVIFFPMMGPATLAAWIKAAQHYKLGVIVGGEMTHEKFLKKDGGYIMDDAPKMIYQLSAQLGVTDFVVPGNKPEKIKKYKEIIEKAGCKNPVFYSPGLIERGGRITDSAKAAGKRWHAIVGRALYESKNIKTSTLELVEQLRG